MSFSILHIFVFQYAHIHLFIEVEKKVMQTSKKRHDLDTSLFQTDKTPKKGYTQLQSFLKVL